MRNTFLREHEEYARLYKVLAELENFCMIEEAVRNAGFVMGFTFATRLLTGQGFTAADSGGAR